MSAGPRAHTVARFTMKNKKPTNSALRALERVSYFLFLACTTRVIFVEKLFSLEMQEFSYHGTTCLDIRNHWYV